MATNSETSFEVLENPIWWGLNTRQSHLALSYGRASRYDPEVSIFGGVEKFDEGALSDLSKLVAGDSPVVRLIRPEIPELPPGWIERGRVELDLMVLAPEDVLELEAVNVRKLTTDDVVQILELIALTKPGPFLPRTIETGCYLGYFQGGRLMAMAGERFHPAGFTEISAVCTHPDIRGRGMASAVSHQVATGIFDRGETPFLYVASNNDRAMSVYRKLGFKTRGRHAAVQMEPDRQF